MGITTYFYKTALTCNNHNNDNKQTKGFYLAKSKGSLPFVITVYPKRQYFYLSAHLK